MRKLSMLRALVVLCVALIVPVTAQQNASSANKTQVASGQKMKVKGMIVKHDQSSITIREQSGSDLNVIVGSAKIEEKKSNPFRGSKKYAGTQLVRGPARWSPKGSSSRRMLLESHKPSNRQSYRLRVAWAKPRIA